MGSSSNWKVTAGKLRDAWQEYPRVKSAISNFPAGKPIFLTGAHRSGTTWAAAMLAEPGLWYVHEPFFPGKGLWPEAFSYADPEQPRADIDKLIRNLLRGSFRAASNNPNTDHPLMPLRMFRPPIKRVMIKDPIGCLLTGYLARNFDFETIVLFRHPAGFATSITRLGWPVGQYLQRFLRNESLMEQHLAPYAQLLEQYQDQNDLRAAAVLHGSLNRVLWWQVKEDPAIKHFYFEDLCEAPITKFKAVFESLGLPYSESTRERHERLSNSKNSSKLKHSPHAVERQSRFQASKWKSGISPDELLAIRKVWEQFDLPMYAENTDWQLH